MPSKAKPKLGQNFLVDEAACLRIADALGDVTQRTVVEIGPGHGAITSILAARCAHLHCVEFDPSLAKELTFKFRDNPRVTIHHADILHFDLATLATEAPAATPPLDVLGNLPYYITSDILLHLYAGARANLLRRGVLMMQREVADRITAAPGVSDYGALSAFTQLHARATSLFTLPPSAFSPPPDVFSTVVRLDFAARFAELRVDPESFNRFLRAGFAQKRKTLANNLRAAGFTAAQLQTAWPHDLFAQIRAEAVSLESLAELYRSLESNPEGTAAPES
jgi:16S rRNA (adenine1518-N6/adenine1519-N6)-dimethyltransferase